MGWNERRGVEERKRENKKATGGAFQRDMAKNKIEATLKKKTILITGAGSLGTELTKQILQYDIHSIRLYDNSEQALFKLQLKFPEEDRLRYILGCVTNKEKMEFACKDVDYVIHAAARKFINYGASSPDAFIDTNIHGTENVIKACMANSVKKAVFISSDKALHHFGIYAKTKAIGEDLWKWGYKISPTTKFSTIRPGNFIPSAGSIFNIWDDAATQGKEICVTDKRMKRYFIPIEDMAKFTIFVLEQMEGGEIFVPKMEEKEIYKLALEYAKGDESRIKIIGLRPGGETLREEIISEEERKIAKDKGDYYVIKTYFNLGEEK